MSFTNIRIYGKDTKTGELKQITATDLENDKRALDVSILGRSFAASTTNDVIAVDATTTEILAANAQRLYALVVNDSNETIYLALGVEAELHKGIRLNANGGSYEIDSNNFFIGAINGISTSGSKNVTIVEA